MMRPIPQVNRLPRFAALTMTALLALAASVALAPAASAETTCTQEVLQRCVVACNDNPGYEGCCSQESHTLAVCTRDYCGGVALWTSRDEACVGLKDCSGANGVGVWLMDEDLCVDDSTQAGLCPSGSYGVVVDGDGTCITPPGPVLASCTGSDIGEVVLDQPVCFHLCGSGYGLVLNGDPECHTVAACPSGSYGVALDGNGCHTLASCPPGKVGYQVDGNQAACVTNPHVPSVGLCPGGAYGVTVDGDTANCHTVAACGGGTYGVSVDGGSCHTVEVCAGATLGARVDGTGLCTPSPVGTCPDGRKGVVLANQEVCPLP